MVPMRLFSNVILITILLAGVAACTGPPDVPVDSSVDSTQPTMALWARSCALCHVDGNAGAPVVGNAQQWLPRLAQGRQTLLQHTVEGLNSMPPLGYCMACEEADFLAMIDFMTAGIVADASVEGAVR